MNRASLIAIGIGLLFCTVGSPAGAGSQITTGYQAFVPYPNRGSQGCISENYGAAMNWCGSRQNYMLFHLPIPWVATAQTWQIRAVGIGAASGWWGCAAVAESPDQLSAIGGSGGTFNWSGPSTITHTVNNVPPGWSLQLQCYGVWDGNGIQNLVWWNGTES